MAQFLATIKEADGATTAQAQRMTSRLVRAINATTVAQKEATKAALAAEAAREAAAKATVSAEAQAQAAIEATAAAEARLAAITSAASADQLTDAQRVHAAMLKQLAAIDQLAATEGTAGSAAAARAAVQARGARDLATTMEIGAKATKVSTLATEAHAKASRGMASGLGAVAFQLPDVLTQLQMGANPMTILTQQGLQVVQMLGMMGVSAGALVTILAPLAAGIALVAAAGYGLYRAWQADTLRLLFAALAI